MKKWILILFVLIPALLASAVFLTPERALSENENRSLMTRKALSHNVKSGAFQEDLEQYFSDQFPARDALVGLQCRLRYALGQRELGGAYLCKDGRLIQKYTPSDLDMPALVRYADRLSALAKEYPLYVLYVPSAETALKNALPKGAPTYDYEAVYQTLSARLGKAQSVSLLPLLAEEKCYYKTDHHWTAEGAYRAYTAFCALRGVAARPQKAFQLKAVCSDFQGTLYSKAPIVKTKDEIVLPSVPSLTVTADGAAIDFYDLSALETKDKYNVFQGGNHGICEIVNPKGKGKTLLVLKDSFANSFVPYIVGEYSRIVMLDERYAFVSLTDYAQALKPDEILAVREIVS